MVRTKKYRIKSNIRKKTLKRDRIKTLTRKKNNNKKKRKRKTQKGGLNSEVIGEFTIKPIGKGVRVYKKDGTHYVYVEGNDIKIESIINVNTKKDLKNYDNPKKGTEVPGKAGWKYYEKIGSASHPGFMNGLVMFYCPNKKKCKGNMETHFNTGEDRYNNLPYEVKGILDGLISSSLTNREKKNVNAASSNNPMSPEKESSSKLNNSKDSDTLSSSKSNNENKSQVSESNVNLQELFNNISASSNKKWNPHKKNDCHNALTELANLDKTKNLTLDKVLELRRKLFVCLPEEANKQLFTSLAASVMENTSNTDIDTDKPEDVIKKIKGLLDKSFKTKIEVVESSEGADKGYRFKLKEGEEGKVDKRYHFIFGTDKKKLYYVGFPGSAFKADIFEVTETVDTNEYQTFDNDAEKQAKIIAESNATPEFSENAKTETETIMKKFIVEKPIDNIKLDNLTLLSPKLVDSKKSMEELKKAFQEKHSEGVVTFAETPTIIQNVK